MYVNTGGGGKTQQQQSLQNQTNVSVRHNNPYPQSHTQTQPHYDHHQGQLAFVYPSCNVAQASHGNTGGNNLGVVGGQAGHMLFQAQHQPQPHPTQQIGLHNTEQTLRYFTKSAPMQAHHLHHAPQQHAQIRNMMAAANHQRQSYMVSPNYFALSHALLPQQNRAPILTNAGPQHPIAAAGVGTMGAQLQNTAPRSIPQNGATAYVQTPYCTSPLLLSTALTAVPSQPGPMLTSTSGIVQPPSLQAYAHMSGGMQTAPTVSTPINMQHASIGTSTSINTEHHTSINTKAKQRKYALPIIHPTTGEVIPYEMLIDAQPKPISPPQTQTKIENNLESISIQTDTDKSLAASSLASDLSDVVPPTTCSNVSSAVETDQINVLTENENYNYDVVEFEHTSGDTMEKPAVITVPEANTTTQSLQSGSVSLKNCAYEDPNDTDADTNEHELDNEDVIDSAAGILAVPCIEQDIQMNLIQEHQIEEVPKADLVILETEAGESDTDHTTEIKSKDEPCTISVQTSLDRNDEEISKEIHEYEDLQPSTTTTAFIVTESKKYRKNKKNAKNKERQQKNSKQQQNKSNNASKQKEEKITATANVKTAAAAAAAAAGPDSKVLEPKSKKCDSIAPKVEDSKPTFIRYTLRELKDLGKSSESCKTPVVPCQKGDCIAQLFVARPQYHHLSHQGQNLAAGSMQQHAPQSYHQMNFNESMEFVSGKRRTVAATARKQYEQNINLASGTVGVGGNSALLQKKIQVIRINLSLNEEIKLSECKNAWQPKLLANNPNNNATIADAVKNTNDDTEDVLKKVRGILNKLTSENFDVLLKEMTTMTINTSEKMQKIMLLIFEKTVSEPNFAPTYAKFCKVLYEEIKAESKEVFNKLLIDRLATEFESNVNNADAKERKLQQIIKKLNDASDPQEKIELQAELEHQEYQFRRRAWGTVRFIGEMFKLRSLPGKRVFCCLESLLDHGNEEKLEYMCKLLTTVGHLLESNDTKSFNSHRMNNIFSKMQSIIKEAKEPERTKIKICSRVRFMMQDLIDLRSKNWGQSTYAQSSHIAPRRRLVEDKNSNLPSSSVNCYERGASQRMSFGNNNNRQNQLRSKDSGATGSSTGNYYMQKSSKSSQYLGQRESIDLKKLNFSRSDESSQSNTKLGTSSVYMWSTIRGGQIVPTNDLQQNDHISPTSSSHKYSQKQPPPPQYLGAKNLNPSSATKPTTESYSSKDNHQVLNQIMEEYLDCLPTRNNRWQDEVFNIWQKTNTKQQLCLVCYVLMDYLHLADVKRLERNACANIFIYLMANNALNKTTFTRAYEQFAEEFPDLLTDVPNGWIYVFQFLGPLLHERLITFKDIWHPNWRSNHQFTERFVNALVNYFTKEFGVNYMRDLWRNEFKLIRGLLFDQQQWSQFVVANKLQFLYDTNAKPEIASTNANNNNNNPATIDQHVQRLEILLRLPNDSNLALDYINTNVNINSYFLKQLTKFLCCDYATTTKTPSSGTSRTSSATTSKNSSTCSNTSNSSSVSISSSNTKNVDSSNNVYLNINDFRNNCLPLLRLCLDGHEDHELACLDSVVDGIQQEYDTGTASELICGIFEILYDCEVIAKESFEKWYKQRILEPKESKIQIKRQLALKLKSYMQKLL